MSAASKPFRAVLASCLLWLLISASSTRAYVDVPPATLGRTCDWSTNIIQAQITQVDRAKGVITWRKLKDLKGRWPGGETFHQTLTDLPPQARDAVFRWAEPGKATTIFALGSYRWCHTYIDGLWYATNTADWQSWGGARFETAVLRTYCGKTPTLQAAVSAILAGKEVVVPCQADVAAQKAVAGGGAAHVIGMKASLRLLDYNAQRDFVNWGGDDFAAMPGLKGFGRAAVLPRLGPDVTAIAVADFDGDGRQDVFLTSLMRVALLQNTGDGLLEVTILGLNEGARSAAWADVDGDGKPDLLLACTSGPKLFLNEGQGKFKDISDTLPHQPYWNLAAATFIPRRDQSSPDILLADGFTGLHYWKNLCIQAARRPPTIKMGDCKICGPFDNTGNRGFAAVYPPEQELKFDATYPGKRNAKAVWKPFELPEGSLTAVKVFGDEALHTFMTLYVHREVSASGPGEMAISVGGGGPIKVWINGKEVVADDHPRQPAADQVKARIPVRAGKNDLLIKYCYAEHGRSCYFKSAVPDSLPQTLYENVSEKVGLGPAGLASDIKASHLLVADVNGDGLPDVLVGGGTGVLLLGTPTGFALAKDSGIRYDPAGVTPLFADFNGDGKLDLIIPQRNGVKLLAGQGNGKFVDVTVNSGAAAALPGNFTSAAIGDFTGHGKQDLIFGCLRGPNRCLENNGGGVFTDVTEALGLQRRIFNTAVMLAADINGDGKRDLIFADEGQESMLLLRDGPEASPVAAGAPAK